MQDLPLSHKIPMMNIYTFVLHRRILYHPSDTFRLPCCVVTGLNILSWLEHISCSHILVNGVLSTNVTNMQVQYPPFPWQLHHKIVFQLYQYFFPVIFLTYLHWFSANKHNKLSIFSVDIQLQDCPRLSH